jgi:hypothetical protein
MIRSFHSNEEPHHIIGALRCQSKVLYCHNGPSAHPAPPWYQRAERAGLGGPLSLQDLSASELWQRYIIAFTSSLEGGDSDLIRSEQNVSAELGRDSGHNRRQAHLGALSHSSPRRQSCLNRWQGAVAAM